MTGELVIAVAEKSCLGYFINLRPVIDCCFGVRLNRQYIPSDNTDSRADLGICSENSSCSCCDCLFRTMDVSESHSICN